MNKKGINNKQPLKRLDKIEVHESSYVDKPANNRKFIIMKRMDEGGDIVSEDIINQTANEQIELAKKNFALMDERLQKLEASNSSNQIQAPAIKSEVQKVVPSNLWENEIASISQKVDAADPTNKGVNQNNALLQMIEIQKRGFEVLLKRIEELENGLPKYKGMQVTAKSETPEENFTEVIKSMSSPTFWQNVEKSGTNPYDMTRAVLKNLFGK